MKTLVFLVAALWAAGLPPAFAGSARPILDLSAGVGLPANPGAFTDGWRAGFSGAGAFGVELTPVVSILGGLDYSRFGVDGEAFTRQFPGLTVDGGATSVFYYFAGAKIVPTSSEGPVDFFLLAGLGFYRVTIAEATISDGVNAFTSPGNDENAFGLHLGTGIEVEPFTFQILYVAGLTNEDATGHFSFRVGVSPNFR